MKKEWLLIVLCLIAGILAGAAATFFTLRTQYQEQQRRSARLTLTTLAASRLAALQTMHQEGDDALEDALELGLEGDRAALAALTGPDPIEAMLIAKIETYRQQHPYTAPATAAEDDSDSE